MYENKKILIVGNDFKFITLIMDELVNNYGYEVKYDLWEGHDKHNKETDKLIEWADILFCEWALGNVTYCQSRKRENQKLIVRAHRFEMNTKFHYDYDYDKIDKIITVSPFVYEEFIKKTTFPRNKLKLVYNAIDTKLFLREKVEGYEFNVAIVGIVPKLKRFDLALDIFEKLYEKDNRYNLFIKGKKPEEILWVWKSKQERAFFKQCYDRIKKCEFGKNVVFEGWGDISEFYQKIGYCLSTSDYESFHLAPLEAAVTGAYPVVLENREGIRPIFPDNIIFEDIQDIIEFILRDKEDFEIKKIEKYIKKYDVKKIANQINKYM